ncbi:MAG: hypothetical protein ACRD2W_13580 [Acidimicrobiales bacterium]
MGKKAGISAKKYSVAPYSDSAFWRFLDKVALTVDRRRGWHRLPTPKSVLLRHHPELRPALSGVKNAFHPWARASV